MKDKWTIVILLLVALSAFLAGYVLRMIREVSPVIYRPTIQTEQQFKRMELKHGRQNTRILKQEWIYIDSNGRKCTLK